MSDDARWFIVQSLMVLCIFASLILSGNGSRLTCGIAVGLVVGNIIRGIPE